MVRSGGRLQRDGDGVVRALVGGSLQFLQSKIYTQNRLAARRSNGEAYFPSGRGTDTQIDQFADLPNRVYT